jgi:hypothetical protein
LTDTRVDVRALAATDPHAAAALFLERRRKTTPAGMTMDLGTSRGVGALLERSMQEREQVVGLIESVTQAAFEASRDLSDQDHDTINRGRERLEFLDKQIDRLSFDTTVSDRARQALATNGVSGSTVPTAYRSAGEAFHDLLHYSDKDARARLDTEMHRAAQHMGTNAAATVPVAGGLGALVVKPVVGPIIDTTPQGRPFLTALGTIPLDSPLGFSRPRIVDNAYGVAPATQTAEKAELVSRAFDIKLDSLDTETVGEYLNVSQKLISYPIPALNMVLAQFSKRRAYKMETRAIAEVLESTTAVPLAAAPPAADEARLVYEAVWEAARLVFLNTGDLPQWIAMGPIGWARLGSLLDASDRPLFPTLGTAVNPMGAMSGGDTFASVGPAGLRAIVTHAITGPELIIGNAMSLEVYEYAYPMLEAIEPSVLGRQVAVASEVAFYRPTTDEPGGAGNGTGNGAVVIAPPAP